LEEKEREKKKTEKRREVNENNGEREE